MKTENSQKFAYLFCIIVVSITVTGFFVGLQSPMNPSGAEFISSEFDSPDVSGLDPGLNHSRHHRVTVGNGTILATNYAEMRRTDRNVVSSLGGTNGRTSLADLKRDFDPLAEVVVTPEQKAFALEYREQNRAFNGAPPTIPHPVEQMSAESCLVCHGEGVKTESLQISRMPHQFLTNCTQCHVESDPQFMTATLFRESSFVGLPAPDGGPRAYDGAPPMIPHSTWMRVECASCHGFSGQQGIRTTHPWRQNCQQCHAPSSQLDQIQINPHPEFLAPPKIDN